MVKLLQTGESYEVSGRDAELVRGVLGREGTGNIILDLDVLKDLVPILIRQKKETVEEYTLVNGKEVLTRKSTPGNWGDFAEYLIDDSDIPKIAAVLLFSVEGRHMVEVCAVSTLDKTFCTASFYDTDIFTNLAQYIHSRNISEVVYTSPSLDKALAALRVAHTRIKSGLVRSSSSGREHAPSFLLLEAYLNLPLREYVSDDTCNGQAQIYMQMDAPTARALLDEDAFVSAEIGCTTPQGRRLLKVFLRQPLVRSSEIERRYDQVGSLSGTALDLRGALDAVPDAYASLKALGRQALSTKTSTLAAHVATVITFVSCASRVLDCVPESEGLIAEKTAFSDALRECTPLSHALSRVVDPVQRAVRPDNEPELGRLVGVRTEIEKELALQYNEEIRKIGISQKKPRLEKARAFGYHIKIPLSESGCLASKKIIRLSSQKSGVLFTTDGLVRISQKFEDIDAEIEKEERRILREAAKEIENYAGYIEVVSHISAYLDVISSLAIFALQNSLVRPVLSSGEYVLRGASHPMLPRIHRKREAAGHTVPEITKNDFELGKKSRCCVITGPNMGGKTTLLKTVALISVLAQIGSYVSASYAEIPVFSSVFLRIGASDAPGENLSTFMVEMLDVSKILNSATGDSLVVIDELGRGTSDADGFAIAQATVEHLVGINCVSLFATHFHEIATVPGVVPKFVSCLIQDKKYVMTYRIRDGVSVDSHGINVARHSGLPAEVVDAAEQALQEEKLGP